MKKIIRPEEIIENTPAYQITDDDIDYVNDRISKLFLEEWGLHPNAKRTTIHSENGNQITNDMCDAIMVLTGWTVSKTICLQNEFIELMRDAGYEIVPTTAYRHIIRFK